MLDHRLESLENRSLLSTVTLLNGMPAPRDYSEQVIEIEPFNSWGGEDEPGVDESLPEEDIAPPLTDEVAGPDDDMYAFHPGIDDATYETEDEPTVTSSTVPPPPSTVWLGGDSTADRDVEHRGNGRVKSNFTESARASYRDIHL